jgi:hypothetical protein
MRRSSLEVFCIVGLVVLGCFGCSGLIGSSADDARASSAKAAREAAERSLKRIREELLISPVAPGVVQKVLDDIKVGEVTEVGIIGSSMDPAGIFLADMSFVAITAAGGGGDYVQKAVRLCVRYSGTVGPMGRVEIIDLTCPAGLPSSVKNLPVESTTTLGG